MENWADGNIIKFNEGKSHVLLLGRNKLVQQYLLRVDQLKSSFAEKVLEVLLDKFHVTQQSALAIKAPNSLLGFIRTSIASKSRSWKDASAALSPVVDSKVQDRHGHTRENPMKAPR